MNNKKGQLTLFIIIGILILGSFIGGYFLYKNALKPEKVSLFSPVKNYYETCVESLTQEAIGISSSRGGYIDDYEFSPGSAFMPFSSELNFLGNPIPYWFYISGNNVKKENVPSRSKIESEIQNYIIKNIDRCDFSEIEERGILVDYEEPKSVIVKLKEDRVDVFIIQNFRAVKDEKASSFSEHKISVKTNLGKMYELAKKMYEKEKEESFLESYTLDTLQMNVPTTGVELSCSPMFFNFEEIRKNLSLALSNNLAYIKVKNKKESYFDVEFREKTSFNFNFMYSSDWPTKIKISGDNIAQPVGLQAGMGILGFCYVPYHLVYDIAYPVLIQIYDDKEMFQFPVIVYIEKNQIKEKFYGDSYDGVEIDVCKNSVQDFSVRVSDLYGNPVEADVKISCFDSGCYLGKTKVSSGVSFLNTKVPQCVNAVLEASASGYSSSIVVVSTNRENSAEIVLKKKYNVNLDLGNIRGNAVVSFEGDGYSISFVYPEKRSVDLVEGFYNVKVMVFSNSSLIIPSFTEKRCFDIPSSGIGGIFGFKDKNCFDVKIPEQKIEGAIIGGGNTIEYFSERDLKSAKKLNINVPLFNEPKSLDDVSENYIKLEDSVVLVSFAK